MLGGKCARQLLESTICFTRQRSLVDEVSIGVEGSPSAHASQVPKRTMERSVHGMNMTPSPFPLVLWPVLAGCSRSVRPGPHERAQGRREEGRHEESPCRGHHRPLGHAVRRQEGDLHLLLVLVLHLDLSHLARCT